MWNLIFKKRKQTNELIYKTETVTDLEHEVMVTMGEGWGRDTVRELGLTCTHCYILNG